MLSTVYATYLRSILSVYVPWISNLQTSTEVYSRLKSLSILWRPSTGNRWAFYMISSQSTDATGNINVCFCFDYVVLKQCKVKIIIPGV